MKKQIILFSIFMLSALPAMSSISTQSKTPPTNDLYSGFQWALLNGGQSVTHDLDDIQSYSVQSNPKIQIGWRADLDQLLVRDVIVAVIDSGVDTNHEDLVGRIALNTAECVNSKPPVGLTGDKDGNGYDGDCLGWNFAAEGVQAGRLVDDDFGHGTHIAGIIAATAGNGIGVAGVSNHIKILPVRVYDEKEEKGEIKRKTSITDRVAKAIDYAVSRGAEVINLSMGWPRMAHGQSIQNSLNKAVQAGVVVVAGAGNDHHEGQVFPCAHEGVICVGSIDLDGQLSDFSNFGGHVDVLAPGGDIVSTWPMRLISFTFGPKGYEVLSGTSQAAPYVSALAAMIKATAPSVSGEEVRARILEGAQSVVEGSLAGLINIEKSLSISVQAAILPTLKGLDHVIYARGTGEFEFKIPLESVGGVAGAEVEVLAANQKVKIFNTKNTVFFGAQPRASVTVKGEVTDLEVENPIILNIHTRALTEIDAVVGKDVSVNHRVTIVQSVVGNSHIDRVEIPATVKTPLSSVRAIGQARFEPEFWTAEKVTDGMLVTLYRRNANALVAIGATVLPGVVQILPDLGITRVDANYDGVADYFLAGVVTPEGKDPFIQYSYLNEKFQPLLGQVKSHFRLNYEGVIHVARLMKFGRTDTAEFGQLAVPVFFEQGPIPAKDKNPDVFAQEPQGMSWRLYYFEPLLDSGIASFSTRSFFNYKTIKSLKNKSAFTIRDDVTLHNAFPQDQSSLSNGQINVLVSGGNGVIRRYVQLTIQPGDLLKQNFTVRDFDTRGLDLQRQSIEELAKYDSKAGELSTAPVVMGVFSRYSARAVAIDQVQAKAASENVVRIQDPTVRIAGHVGSFEIDGDIMSFIESSDRLVASGQYKGKEVISFAPIYRFSFLPGQLFTQRFWSYLSRRNGESARPALVVDNSTVFSPTLTTWTLNNKGELVMPAALAIEVPAECRAMNPSPAPSGTLYVMNCSATNSSNYLLFFAP